MPYDIKRIIKLSLQSCDFKRFFNIKFHYSYGASFSFEFKQDKMVKLQNISL